MGVIKPPATAQEILGAAVDIGPISAPIPTSEHNVKASAFKVEWKNYSSLQSRFCSQCNPQATRTEPPFAAATTEGDRSQHLTQPQIQPSPASSTLQDGPTPKQDAATEAYADPTSTTDTMVAASSVISVASFEDREEGASANTDTRPQNAARQSYPYARDPRWAPRGFITSPITKRHSQVDATTAVGVPIVLTPSGDSSTSEKAVHAFTIFILATLFLLAFAAYLIALRAKITHTDKRGQRPPSLWKVARDSPAELLSSSHDRRKKRDYTDNENGARDRLSPPNTPYASLMSTPLSGLASFGSSTALSSPQSAQRRRFPSTPSASSASQSSWSTLPSPGPKTPRSPRVEVKDEEGEMQHCRPRVENTNWAATMLELFQEERNILKRAKDSIMALPDDEDERPLLPMWQS